MKESELLCQNRAIGIKDGITFNTICITDLAVEWRLL